MKDRKESLRNCGQNRMDNFYFNRNTSLNKIRRHCWVFPSLFEIAISKKGSAKAFIKG